ncbi:MAG: sugar phosphate isomerase/epimerase, partial [Chloroflexi bacterium]|nr:sugar phosphate isomerase/epimerase [Chloroflexota bacterium]
MILTMHGLSTMHNNLRSDIRLAGETGYEAIEILASKLLRYLDQGYRAEDLRPLLREHGVRAVCINALANVERASERGRRTLLAEARRLCVAAEALSCPTIQLVPLTGLAGRPWCEVLEQTARNVAAIADIGAQHGVRFQLEPVAWAPIHSLEGSLALIDAVERANVGMVIDFWHLWAGEDTTPDEVAQLD